MKYLIIIHFTLYFFTERSSQQVTTKIWIPNTNYNDPKNWLGHQLPCETSKIIFPDDLNAAIYLPTELKVREIVLSNDGELVLKPSGSIDIFDEQISSKCQKDVVQFKKFTIEPWLKATNWRIKDGKNNIAIPDSERIPCTYDSVVFPKDSSFWVQYPEISLTVNSLSIEDENLTNYQLQSYLLSGPGTRQFKNLDYQLRTDVIAIKTNVCQDRSGCLCQKNSEFILSAICKNSKHICNITHCLNPIKPAGYCCTVCGAHLILQFDKNNFDFNFFKLSILQYLHVSDYNSNLDIYINKILYENDYRIQITIIEKDFHYKGDSINFATQLNNHITTNLKTYNLIKSDLKISGPEYWPGSNLKTTIAIVLGTLFGVLIALTIIYLTYGGPLDDKKFNLPFRWPNFSNFRPFIFVRFENSGEADGGANLEFENRSVASSLFNLDRAFENPMFEEPLPSTSEKKNEDIHLEGDFINPIFSNLKDLSDEE